MANEHREKGIQMFNEVYCNDLPQPPEPGKDRFFDYMLDTFGYSYRLNQDAIDLDGIIQDTISI